MIDLHLSAFAPRWRFLYAVRIDAYVLKKYYPHLKENTALEVSDEIAATLSIGGRLCDSYKRRKQDHGECSLDTDPGFEADVTYPPPSL